MSEKQYSQCPLLQAETTGRDTAAVACELLLPVSVGEANLTSHLTMKGTGPPPAQRCHVPDDMAPCVCVIPKVTGIKQHSCIFRGSFIVVSAVSQEVIQRTKTFST